jgi:hypothetical protein
VQAGSNHDRHGAPSGDHPENNGYPDPGAPEPDGWRTGGHAAALSDPPPQTDHYLAADVHK